jgi:hypothetical protein
MNTARLPLKRQENNFKNSRYTAPAVFLCIKQESPCKGSGMEKCGNSGGFAEKFYFMDDFKKIK